MNPTALGFLNPSHWKLITEVSMFFLSYFAHRVFKARFSSRSLIVPMCRGRQNVYNSTVLVRGNLMKPPLATRKAAFKEKPPMRRMAGWHAAELPLEKVTQRLPCSFGSRHQAKAVTRQQSSYTLCSHHQTSSPINKTNKQKQLLRS